MMPSVYPPQARPLRLGVALAALVGFVVLVGAGCSRSGLDPAVDQNESPKQYDADVPLPADDIPPDGQPYNVRSSQLGNWEAFALNEDDGSSTYLRFRAEAPVRLPVRMARPIGFSPDEQLLIIAGAPENIDCLLYIRLHADGKIEQPTPLASCALATPPTNRVRTPAADFVDWSGHVIRYVNPGEENYTINVDTGEVIRVAD